MLTNGSNIVRLTRDETGTLTVTLRTADFAQALTTLRTRITACFSRDGFLMRLEPLRRQLAVFRASWEIEKQRPQALKRKADELAFLPAVLEILETPVSPVGRAIAFAIMALCTTALVWACLGELDIHATAPGRIIPGGKTKPVAAIATATVTAIHVAEGDRVREGDVLVELDPTDAQADTTRIERDRVEAQVAALRLHAELDGKSDIEVPLGMDVPIDILVVQKSQLYQKLADHKATIAGLLREKEQRVAEAKSAEAEIKRLSDTVPLLEERTKTRQDLMDQGYGSRIDYLSVKQDLVDRQQQLEGARDKLNQAIAAIASADEHQKQAEAQFRADALSQLSEAEQKAASLAQDLAKAEERGRLTKLTAPVNGVVQQLTVHAPGAVVSPGVPVLMVVPDNEGIAVEANLPNKDAGFVRSGQLVEIKVDSFPFTRYGTIPGVVLNVSGDAVQSSDSDQNHQHAGQNDTGVYSVRIKPNEDRIKADGQWVKLTPGMQVTAEIKTGRRRVIEYVLDPVLRYRDESLRER